MAGSKENSTLDSINRNTQVSFYIITPFYISQVRVNLKCSIQFRAHQGEKDVDKFYFGQLGTTKQLQHIAYEERLRELGLFNLEKT